jgi:hypothetical protein
MFGTAIVWHYHHNLLGRRFGPFDNTQWHATVAKLLGINPAPTADPRALEVPETARDLELNKFGGANYNSG